MTAGRLAGKVAIVTGGASGLGHASALLFGREGAKVAIADLDGAGAERAAAEIATGGGEAIGLELDVTDGPAVERAVATTIERFGAVDVLFANAGIAGEGNAATLAQADWDRVIAVNLTSVWLSMRAVLPHMAQRGSGAILATASVAGITGVPNTPAYSAAKGGVVALTRQVAIDFAGQGVRVNAICPGPVLTPLFEEAFRERAPEDPQAALSARAATVPLGRLGAPADIANMALFLVSDEADWITGAVYAVDGGITAAMVPGA
jgi:NAD(P)-dependent dehydrogenase (short-subunit alcohol dehydrogenase family)